MVENGSHVNGKGHPEASAGEVDAVPEAPPEVAELAEACVRFVQAAVGIAPDYSIETLPLVDHYARSAGEAARERPEAGILVLRSLAAYLGEVARRSFDGYWHTPGDDPADWEIRLRRVFLTFNPYALAAAAVLGAEGDDDPGFRVDDAEREELAARLAALGDVDTDDYRTPSTRFEVLQLAVDMLQAKADAAGLGDVVLNDDDYED